MSALSFCSRTLSALLIIAAMLLSGCRSTALPSGPNLKFHTVMRDFIQNDTLTKRVFDHPDSLRVWVLDETAHLGINTWDYEGVLEWMGLQRDDPGEGGRIMDSLRQFAPDASWHEEIIPELRELSTTDDITYAVVFMNIDSVLIPGYYVLAACLAHNTCRGNTVSRLFSERMMWYVLILGKDAEIYMATSGGPWYPELWDPCD